MQDTTTRAAKGESWHAQAHTRVRATQSQSTAAAAHLGGRRLAGQLTHHGVCVQALGLLVCLAVAHRTRRCAAVLVAPHPADVHLHAALHPQRQQLLGGRCGATRRGCGTPSNQAAAQDAAAPCQAACMCMTATCAGQGRTGQAGEQGVSTTKQASTPASSVTCDASASDGSRNHSLQATLSL